MLKVYTLEYPGKPAIGKRPKSKRIVSIMNKTKPQKEESQNLKKQAA
jgi:hypothetical protein